MQRILFVTHNVPRVDGDAAGSFILRLAVALQHAGVHVDIVAPGAPGLVNHTVLEGVAIERVPYASDAHMTLAYTGTMAEAVRTSWRARVTLLALLVRMRKAVRRAITQARVQGRPYDVVHAHWWFPSALALWRSWRAGDPPLVITMHGSDVRLAEHLAAAHPVMRAVLAEARVRTAVSSWLADTAHRIAPAGHIDVSPMPVDVRHFTMQDDAPPTRTGLLFVGRLNAQKGLRDLLEALALPPLAHQQLHVVGDGPDRDALKALAVARGIDARVHWHGTLPQPALVPFYRQAQVVVIPSRGEGLGLVAVEAQLCATPVVAYADAGLLDVVRPGTGGTLVTPGDTGALADAIARVVVNDAAARALGRAARADMLARFTPEAAAARYIEHYHDATH